MSILSKPVAFAAAAVIIFSFAGTAPVYAQQRSGTQILDERFFYEIGGAPRFKRRRIHQIPIGLPLEADFDLMCGNFNSTLSLKHMLNDAKSKVRSAMDDLEATATGLVWSIPGMVWKRSDPESYELFQNYKALGESFINVAVNSCEQSIKNMEAGGGLVDSVVSYSVTGAWADYAKDAKNTDVVQADEQIKNNKGSNGLPWIGGKQAGGVGQDPINVVSDTVRAGYNWLMGRNNDLDSDAGVNTNVEPTESNSPFSGTGPNSTHSNSVSASDPYFTRIWPAPTRAEEWAKDVIGEVTLRTCSASDSGCGGSRLVTVPGRGVVSKIEERQAYYQEKLSFLVDSTRPVHRSKDLSEVSTVSIYVTQKVIDMLRAEDQWQDTLIGRLAEDLAMDDTVEKFIALNRIFRAGMAEANLANNEAIKSVLKEKMDLLQKEQDFIEEQGRLRELLGGSVITSLYDRDRARRGQSDMPSLQRDESRVMDELNSGSGG